MLAKAREVAPLLTAQAEKNEKLGRLGDETLAAMRKGGADFFSILIPKSLGGAELFPGEAMRVVEALSYGDGSAGWVVMAAQCCTGTAAAFLPRDAAKEVFKNGIPIIAGQGQANGRADIEGNGYRLSGSWNYGSGVLHSDYIHTGAAVYENGKPKLAADGHSPEILTFIVPTKEVKFNGNWDVMGLRATGSVDYSFDGVFVPAEFTHRPEATEPIHGGNVFTIGILGLTSWGHTSFILGVGRRILDELSGFARARPAARGGHLPNLRDTDRFQEGFAHAEARYRASRAFIYEAWDDIDATLARGERIGKRQVTLARLALNHSTSEIADVCAWAYKTGGGHALRPSTLQRCFRDTYAGTQHFLTSGTVLKECGRELAGLAEGQEWSLLGLTARR